MPAIRATAKTSPLGWPPCWIICRVSGSIRTSASATASRAVTALAVTSTMLARPWESRWVSIANLLVIRTAASLTDRALRLDEMKGHPVLPRVCSRFVRVRAGACFFSKQGTRSVVWSLQISDEKRRIAQKQARPERLRGKCRHAALRDLARERPLPASRALPGDICRSNAERDETGTDPRALLRLLAS